MATVGNVTADIVKRYVEEQWEKENSRVPIHLKQVWFEDL